MGKKPQEHFVTDAARLRAIADRMRKSGRIGFDTEFVGERSYFPRLCLIQLGTEDEVAAVDPLFVGDLSPIEDLLFDPSILKIVHAGRQDLKIIRQRTGRAPAPVFDVQIAASVLGFSVQSAYASLVREFLGVDLKKGHSYSDWSARPLSEAQLSYALDDVRYLPALHEQMAARLENEGRMSWIEREMEVLVSSASCESVPEEEYRRVKGWAALERKSLAVLRELIAWREREAMRRDVPRRRVLADESALAIARSRPTNEEALRRVRGLEWKASGASGDAVLEAVRKALALPRALFPETPPARPPGNGERSSVVALMGVLLRTRARTHRVAPELIACADDLERLAFGERNAIPALKGWRFDLVGRELLLLLDGKISLAARDGKVIVEQQKL